MQSDFSDNQRRFICRSIFLLLAVVPTCVTIYAATHRRSPDQWAQLIQAELGIQTTIGAIETPLPDELIVRDLKLYDNDGQPILESLVANIKLGNINRIDFRNPIQVKCEGLSHLIEEASQRLIKPNVNAKPWEITFQNFEVISKLNESSEYYRGFDMKGLHIGWFNGRDGRMVMMECPINEINGQAHDDRVWLRLDRNYESGTFNVSFDTTKNGSIPCWLARHWFPQLENELGPDAEFSGVAAIASNGGDTQCDLTGRIVNVGLPQIAGSDRFGLPADLASRRPTSIFVNGLRLEDTRWTLGTAAIQVGDNQYRQLVNPWQDRPAQSPENGLFSDVIQAAFFEDFGATLNR